MKIYKEVNGFDEFDGYQPWAGAVDTVDTLREHNKLEEAWAFIEDYFDGICDYVSETSLNDFLWFEPEYIYEAVGLTEDGEEPDDEDDEDDEDEDEEDYEDEEDEEGE